MPMKKQDRKIAFAEIIKLMLQNNNKEAFNKLTCMCGEDTGLFVMVDYEKAILKNADGVPVKAVACQI
ncbi:hypothetical protein [Shewanella frigidimarina]|uniref:hypothetical protein n=1 Tax=Shewanella frigidimarina TaxID=56812 RepID=UPI003D7A6F9C